MSSEFILCFEGNVAHRFAELVRADEVGLGEMNLKVLVFFIVNIFVLIPTEMASQVLPIDVLEELNVVKQEFLTKVAVRVGQHVTKPFVTYISILNMIAQ